MDEIVSIWNKALYLLLQDQINEAYCIILDTQDDLYLLRLMAKTGVCYHKLDHPVQRDLKERVRLMKDAEFVAELIQEFLPIEPTIEPTEPKEATPVVQSPPWYEETFRMLGNRINA